MRSLGKSRLSQLVVVTVVVVVVGSAISGAGIQAATWTPTTSPTDSDARFAQGPSYGPSALQQANHPTVSVGDVTMTSGESTTTDVVLSQAPNGLSGYQITLELENPNVASIDTLSIPDTFAISDYDIGPDNTTVVFDGADLEDNIEPGASDVRLASVELTGEAVGDTQLRITSIRVEDDNAVPNPIDPERNNGTVTVEPADGTNEPPIADAGEDQTVEEDTSVTLDARSSTDPDDDPLAYAWTQVGGTDVDLHDADTATPTFTAPQVSETVTLTFEVTVTDAHGETDTDTVTVKVAPANEPPTADAGDDRTVEEGTSVALDASESSDPDDDTLAYAWEQTSGDVDVDLTDADTATPTFTAPSVATTTTVTFELTVDDGHGHTATDTVTVTIEPAADSNDPPTADAGEDQTLEAGTAVTLDASESSDPDDDPLTYSWHQVSGPDIDLTDADTATPTFTAPSVSQSTDLTFGVTVADGHGHHATDTVTITVQPENEPPTADAGDDRTVEVGATVRLDGSDSSDPDSDALAYAWEQTGSGPEVTLTDARTPTPEFTAPDVDTPTTLTFELTVTDSHGDTDTDTVTVTVEPASDPNTPPTANAGDDRTVDEETMVTLDARGSEDPDSDTLEYEWEQTGGERTVDLANADTATPTFTAPSVSQPTDLVFEVTVIDEHGATDTDTVTITIEPTTAPNTPPRAIAGDDRTVEAGATVRLDGSGSSDPDGDALEYAWDQVGNGPTVALSGADTATPTFTAPDVDTPTTLTFALTVADSHGATATDTVTVTVEPTSEKSLQEILVQRLTQMAADGDLTREELGRLVDDLTPALGHLLQSLTADGTISDADIDRLADAIAEEQRS